METINIEGLRTLVEKHPLKQVRGRFRVSIRFEDWIFSADGEDTNKPSQAFADFLKKEKPLFTFLAEDNSFSFTFGVVSPEIFDGDGPNEESDMFFLLPDREEFSESRSESVV